MPTKKKKPQRKAAETRSIVSTRPAETTTGVAAALATLFVIAFQIEDPAVVGAITAVLGALPGIVTWIVTLRRGT